MSSMWDRRPRKHERTVREDFGDAWRRRIGLWSIPFRILGGALKRFFYGPAALLHSSTGRIVFCAGVAAMMLDAAFGSDPVTIPILGWFGWGWFGWLLLFGFGCYAWSRRMHWEEQVVGVLHAAVPGHSHAVPVAVWFPPRLLRLLNVGRWRGQSDFAFRIPGGLAASKAPEVEEILRQRLPAAKGSSWRFEWDFRRGVCSTKLVLDLPEDRPLRREAPAAPARTNGRRNGSLARPAGDPEKVPLGESLGGIVVYWILDSNFGNLLIAGTPGGGKSVVINTVVRHCLEFAADFLVYGIDMKGGVELSHLPKFRNVKEVAEDLDSSLDLLRRIKAEVKRREKLLKADGVKKISKLNEKRVARGERPLKRLVLIVDELAELTGIPEKGGDKEENAKKTECKMLLDSIVRLGRAEGVHLVAALQRPDAQFTGGGMRGNMQARVATGRLDRAGCDMIDSKIAGELPGIPGRGVFWRGGHEQIVQYYLTEDEDLDVFLPAAGASGNGSSGSGPGDRQRRHPGDGGP